MTAPQPAAGPAPAGRPERAAVSLLASGVSVLTVSVDGVPHGTTASTVVPISREPLLIGFCLRASSTFTQMVTRRKDFSVNVLVWDQASAARWFASVTRGPGERQFAGLEWTADPLTSAPLLSNSLSHLACRLTQRHRIGDHDLIVARVLAGSAGDGSPLLSLAGRLHPGPLTASTPALEQP